MNIWPCPLSPRIMESQNSTSSPKQSFFLQYPNQPGHTQRQCCVWEPSPSLRRKVWTQACGMRTQAHTRKMCFAKPGSVQESASPLANPCRPLCGFASRILFTHQTGGKGREGAVAVCSANTAVWAKQTTGQPRREQATPAPPSTRRKTLEVRKCLRGKATVSHLCLLILKVGVTGMEQINFSRNEPF